MVLLMEVVEHLPLYPEDLFREISRVLKPTGVLLLTTPNFARLGNVLNFIRGREIRLYGWDVSYDDDPKYHPHIHEFTVGELRRLLSVAGFEIEAVQYSLWPVSQPKGFRARIHRLIERTIPHLKPALMIVARRSERRIGT